ncbi:MAG: hypothetical protein HOH24_09600 [Chromatiales bacterium]|jgi:hypothetical protein|nr:hypothetical protein [Chromatiales bacterium]
MTGVGVKGKQFFVLVRRPLAMLLCIAVLASGLNGCSRTGFAYNQIDWVLTFYLARHFDLDKQQKVELREMVDRNLAWHRQTQLPLYSDYLAALAASLDETFTPEQASIAYDEMLDFWDASMLHIIPDAQVFLSGLTDEQVQQMIQRMEENNQELFEEYSGVTEEERKANRDERTIKILEQFLGKLNAEQKQYISNSLGNMRDATQDWIENRRRWQLVFVQLVKEHPPQAEYRERLTNLYVYPRYYDEPEFQKTVDANLVAALDLTSGLINSLTPKQREGAKRRLNKYASDFRKLSAKSVSR